MGRAPCCEDKQGLKKGAWTAEEDEKLVSFIKRNKGHGSWRTLPKLAGLERCGKSCRLRWTNYLRPNIKRGNFSSEEERMIIHLHAFMGNKWSSIASHLPGRTDNEVKNHWNTHLKKRLAKMGIDPTTHLPLQFLMPQTANYYSNHYQLDEWKRAMLQRSLQQDPAIACHLVQWELARLEAETRMQIAAHDPMQSYAAWLQSLQQLSQTPSYNLNDYMHAAINLQLQSTLTPSNAFEPLQPSQYCEGAANIIDDQFLKQLNPLENEENDCLANSNYSMATPETCSTSESTDPLQLPDLLVSSSNENPLSPPSLDHANFLHDSYWNKMLNLLDPPTLDNLL